MWGPAGKAGPHIIQKAHTPRSDGENRSGNAGPISVPRPERSTTDVLAAPFTLCPTTNDRAR